MGTDVMQSQTSVRRSTHFCPQATRYGGKIESTQQFAVGGWALLLVLAVALIGSGCHPDKKVTVWDKEVVLRIVEAPDTCAVGETISLLVSFENTTAEPFMLRLSNNLWLILPPSDDPNIICAEPLFAMNSDSVFDIHLKGGETCTQDVEFVPFGDVMPGSYPYIAAYGMILDREGSMIRIAAESAPRTIVVTAE